MTTRPTDDHLARDPRFDAAWRTASNEEPPSALDAEILAAAHREVGAKPQSLAANAAMRARRRWWPLAAAATVAVIAIGVVQRAGHDELVAPPGGSSIVADMPAQAAKSIAEAPQRAADAPQRAPDAPKPAQPAARSDASSRGNPAAPPAKKKSESLASTPMPLEKKSETVAEAAPPLPEPFPAASQSAPMAERSAERGAAQRQETATLAKPAAPPVPPATSPPSSGPPPASFADSTRVSGASAMRAAPTAKTANIGAADETRIKDRAALPVTDWIALIRRLRDEGKTVEAARELGAFRAAHLDHEKLLPPDLRDWHPVEK